MTTWKRFSGMMGKQWSKRKTFIGTRCVDAFAQDTDRYKAKARDNPERQKTGGKMTGEKIKQKIQGG